MSVSHKNLSLERDCIMTGEIYFGLNIWKWLPVFKMVAIARLKISTFVAILQNYHRYCWATPVIMHWGDAAKLHHIM